MRRHESDDDDHEHHDYDEGNESDDSADDEQYEQRVAVGVETKNAANMYDTLNKASINHQDLICIPLFHPRYRTDAKGISDFRQGAITRSDMALDDQDWTSNVIGQLSYWIDLDNENNDIRTSSEIAIKREYLYSSHLGLQAVMLNAPGLNSENYARCIATLLAQTPPTAPQLWLRVPLVLPQRSAESGEVVHHDGWELWDRFRHNSGHSHRVHVALELPVDLEHVSLEGIARWAAEPVKAVLLHTDCFGTNKQCTKPKLSYKYQFILHTLFKFNIHVILRGRPHGRVSTAKYLQYIEQLCARGADGQGQGPFSLYDRFEHPYRDNLQSPLHPLSDNLDSETYRVMEQDPVKYSQYQLALQTALVDLRAARQQQQQQHQQNVNSKGGKKRKLPNGDSSNSNCTPTEPIVVMVVGAGRGPLVQAALNASEASGVEIKVFAVEKNFNAVVTLRNRFFAPIVTVLSTDMRELGGLVARLGLPPLQADIIVSELLGSWGDNELSPECLDTVQGFLRPRTGVMIPQSYESYLAPMAAPKLWSSAKDMVPPGDARSGLDSPYVVNLHSCHVVTEAKSLFKFDHPNPTIGGTALHNARYRKVSFPAVDQAVTIHGFAGYFDCALYREVGFSTVPQTFSEGMFSWFPLFVPLRVPLRLNKGDAVTVCVWRCVGADKVWYEWCLSEPSATVVQNSNGASYSVKL